MKRLSALLFVIFVYGQTANATILMIDNNYSSKEVQTAKAAAAARGEDIIIIPDITADQRKLTDAYKAKDDELENKYEKQIALVDKLIAADPAYAKLQKQYQDRDRLDGPRDPALQQAYNLASRKILSDIRARKDELQNRPDVKALIDREKEMGTEITNFNEASEPLFAKKATLEEIKTELIKLQKNGKGTSSLIISGHHSGGKFYGDHQDGFQGDELANFLSANPDISQSIHSMYLWGCSTLNEEEIRMWKGAVPGLNVIAGWDGSAPHETRAIDTEFLRSMMAREKTLSSTVDAKKLSALYHSVKDINISNAALCAGTNMVGPRGSSTIDVSGPAKCDAASVAKGNAAYFDIQKYLRATDKEHERIPDDSQSSPLRIAYTNLQRVMHCPEINDKKNELASIIRLIHMMYIQSNFQASLEKEKLEIIEGLKNSGISDELLYVYYTEFSRAGVIDYQKKLEALSEKANQSVTLDPAIKTKLSDYNKKFRRILIDCKCTSEPWMEINYQPDRLTLDQSCIDQ